MTSLRNNTDFDPSDVLPILEYEPPSYYEVKQLEESEYTKKADDYKKFSETTTSNVFRRVKIDILSPTDTVILIMGNRGAGKTKFFEALAPNSSPYLGLSGSVDIWFLPGLIGPNVAVIILPGIGGTTPLDTAIWEQNAAILKDMYNRNLTLSGIVYLQPISEKPTSSLLTRSFHAFEKVCGKEAAAGVLLVTTKWDNARPDLAKQREDHLRCESWAWLLNHGASLFRFDGTTDSAWRVLRPCFKRRNRYVLQLQRELAAKLFMATDVGLLVLSSAADRHHHHYHKTPNYERDSLASIINTFRAIESAGGAMHIPILPGVLSAAINIVELVQSIKIEDRNITKATKKWLSLMHSITKQLLKGPVSSTLHSALECLLRDLEDVQVILERLEFTQMKPMWQRFLATRHTENEISECNTKIENTLNHFQLAAMISVDQRFSELIRNQR